MQVARKVSNKFKRTTSLCDEIVKRNWDSVIYLCENNPQRAKKSSLEPNLYDGEHVSKLLPIHLIVASDDPPKSALEAVISAYPKGLDAKESAFNRLPIHVACRQRTPSPRVVNTLLKHYEIGAREKDSFHRIPLHYACFSGAAVDVVLSLLEAFPDGVKSRDKDGWLPLHVACSAGAPLEVVVELVRTYPQSLSATTDGGRKAVIISERNKHPNKDAVVSFLRRAESTLAAEEPRSNGKDDKGAHSVRNKKASMFKKYFYIRLSKPGAHARKRLQYNGTSRTAPGELC
mmetsp:Transcript_16590/g.20665  ORF Transcript_16590/g.20665 Transcript_16590/m.20665 type:complete len:289 (-) Transcript_16590:183-1049(-)|eukprot:CAMPEP_0172500624 /NCGR_PEP_ID=MMETSP1066-20121228/141089_1 /TAXON_ID=671091 /ORGANISM="Coscinodiscus wailesii, Strain CCMP2513" /LENGTH=288 /DNA_ID=CAMNT_0013274957 /DNA_START=46 /DNA_END=912 /DNA_ORIENTATION=-